MNFGPMEMGLIFLAVLLLFGYKRLPDASRSLGRSLRIFKGEMKGMKNDDEPRRDTGRGEVSQRELLPPSAVADAALGAESRQGRSLDNGTRPDDAAH